MYNRAALRYTGYNEKEDADGSAPSKTKTNPKQCFTKKIELGFAQYGGPGGIRTLDLSDANRTLSQLSYRPILMTLIVYRVLGRLSSDFGERKRGTYKWPSCQKATALAAATLRESTPWDMGIFTV